MANVNFKRSMRKWFLKNFVILFLYVLSCSKKESSRKSTFTYYVLVIVTIFVNLAGQSFLIISLNVKHQENGASVYIAPWMSDWGFIDLCVSKLMHPDQNGKPPVISGTHFSADIFMPLSEGAPSWVSLVLANWQGEGVSCIIIRKKCTFAESGIIHCQHANRTEPHARNNNNIETRIPT